MTPIELERLDRVLKIIQRVGSVPLDEFPSSAFNPADFDLDGDPLSFRSQPDLLDSETLESSIGSHRIYHAIGSTSSQLKLELEAGSHHPAVLLAEYQDGGRGRHNRSWHSPYARSLSISFAHRTVRAFGELGGLSSVVGIGVVEMLHSLGAMEVMLKWPNDVLVGRKKLCGVLTEIVSNHGKLVVVIGIGLNVELTEGETAAIDQPVTDLRALGVSARRTSVVIELLKRVREVLREFEADGFEPFCARFDQIHGFQGRPCRVIAGEEETAGTVVGIAADGALRLRTEDGVKQFYGGEVSLRI